MVTFSKRNKATGLLKDGCHISAKLLPFKFHFFFFFGGFAAVMPFMPIIAKQLGISATAVGIAFSLIPIFTFLSNPIIGFLVDYFQNIKVSLVLLLITSAVSFGSIMSLPPVVAENQNVTYVQLTGFDDSEHPLNFSKPFTRSCLENLLKNGVECALKPEIQAELFSSNETLNVNVGKVAYNFSILGDTDKIGKNNSPLNLYDNDFILPNVRNNTSSLQLLNCSPDIFECSTNGLTSNGIYSTYQFWAFFCLTVTGAVAMMTASSLSSVASYELLGPQKEIYGRQRLFGTISWGIVCPLSGILNDLQTQKNFVSGIYLMSAFLIVDLTILCVISIPKAYTSSSMGKDICTAFSSKDILVFSFGIVCMGTLNAVIAVFEFWFLEDMGASRTLLGMSVFMQCIVGEVPFLFFSGWFVEKLGHFLCFAFSFAGFLLRLVFYFLLKNPWLVLPVDILHGVTFGVFHGAMTSFAKFKAPKGMEATLLGTFGGLYDGLGYGIGSFLGGLGLDKLGPKQTFFSASMVSLGCFLLFLVASFLFRSPRQRRKSQEPRLEMTQFAANSYM